MQLGRPPKVGCYSRQNRETGFAHRFRLAFRRPLRLLPGDFSRDRRIPGENKP